VDTVWSAVDIRMESGLRPILVAVEVVTSGAYLSDRHDQQEGRE